MAKVGYVAPITLGRVSVALGKLDEAFAYYDKALAEHNQGFQVFKLYEKFWSKVGEPKYITAFRKDPRYQKLMARLAFPD